MADLDALNDPELLADTPLGDLCARQMPGGWLGIGVADPDRPERFACFHDLSSGDGTLLGAIYGRRHFERAAVCAMYAQRDEREREALAEQKALIGADLRRGLDQTARRQGDDFRELIRRSLLGHTRRDG